MKCILGLCLGILVGFGGWPAQAGEPDLLEESKTDPAVKPLVFPKSLKVIQNRPRQGWYHFYEGQAPRFNDGLPGEIQKTQDRFDTLLSDPQLIRKTLVKTDPVRIAPASRGEDVRGPITHDRLRDLKTSHAEDMLLVFRRQVILEAADALPPVVFLEPARLLTGDFPGASPTPVSLRIQTRGLIYLANQDRILALPAEEQTLSLKPGGPGVKKQLEEAARTGLENLAEAARKVIRDHQFVKRRPSY
ncbi:MAG: hypothetical protein GWM98_09875 [Nitrospinaceae bacterium]|nr:hypothetical protein [Nitrospinaceae bacterium]NIS85159.1 hypothetical protein [Nitrospinaceae bacterium]NIT81975.1 hypothetical protein [Nitrospinaceae bacterium]NIU96359.1 hypothetical protein [Nitrospinaceae bacterium]NIY15180.1 hypothetical protein [Nitrospinaceae bacterium]